MVEATNKSPEFDMPSENAISANHILSSFFIFFCGHLHVTLAYPKLNPTEPPKHESLQSQTYSDETA